jgi:hypothetical protein
VSWLLSRTRNQSGAVQVPTAAGAAAADTATAPAGPRHASRPAHARATETEPRPGTAEPGDPPDGGLAAALLAAGLGCALFGLLVVVSERSEAFAEHVLTLSEPVGPLSGKAVLAVVAWAALWALLHLRVGRCTVDLGRWLRAALVLVALGLLTTFPPVFLYGVH